MPNLKVGDVVRLKSGGPKMTVSTVDEYNHIVYCKWFVHDELKSERFSPDSLEVISE